MDPNFIFNSISACSAPPAGTAGEVTACTDACSVDVVDTVSMSRMKKNPQSSPQQRRSAAMMTCGGARREAALNVS